MTNRPFLRGLSAFLAIATALPASRFAHAETEWTRAGAEPADDDPGAEPAPEPGAEPAPADDLGPEDPGPPPTQELDAVHAGDVTATKRRPLAGDTAEAPPTLALAPTSSGSKSAATPQAIPLPKAEGSIQGMGESFSPVLSSGSGTFTIPIAVPPGRAGVQPSLAFAYSSSAGNGPLGIGWSIGTPFIARQSDRGLPRYADAPAWTPREDRFFFNGGQELVPVDSAAAELADCGSLGCAPVPAELAGWQQYRARLEGGFMRFFRAPDARRWVVQSPDGTRLDLGALPAGDGPAEMVAASVAALQSEHAQGQGRVNRWLLTRTSDAHGSVAYYRHDEHEGERYLADIFYLSPHGTCGALAGAAARMRCDAPLASYGRRVRFVYETRPDALTSYTAGWAIRSARRLRRIELTAATGAPGTRTLVRRYHLRYDPASYLSLLASVQLEGRPTRIDPLTGAVVGRDDLAEDALGEALVGQRLAPARFTYTTQPISFTAAPGFGSIDGTVHTAAASPPYSVGSDADLFDVNSDGLPDLLVTEPARYHTEGGEPAVGVYFNGFTGAATQPASGAGTFSGAVAMAVPAGLSFVLRLANANVSPMDADGDGRGDLLHMPRQASYGYFTPVRNDDDTAVAPAAQGWQWAHLDRHLPAGDLDPRIDFASDGEHIRVFDVNNDHLVDVVRTTGDRVQTWLNLGWLPGGDGRFGSYQYDAPNQRFTLSTLPLESCLPVAGTPLDFDDPEVRLGDMNGDGLQDIVRARKDRVIYWPGRGEGAFGTGAAACGPGLAPNRHVEMTSPPAELGSDLTNVHLADANGDGTDDLVQVRYTSIDVWFNKGGTGFTGRLTRSGTPYAPAFDTRVRVTDIDGSGTLDVLYANADHWQWVDLMGGQRPRLLASVDNGLGALSEITYGSSVEDYLRDLRAAATCVGAACESFTWNGRLDACDAKVLTDSGTCAQRPGGSPVVSTVVRRFETSDRFDAFGLQENRQLSRFEYHDGYYEGIEQEFRGFGAADTTKIGDETQPTSIERTHLHQGRRPGAIASDRLADNLDEALKGSPYLSEQRDEANTYLGTTHTTYTLRPHVVGLSGVSIVYAFGSQTDSLSYDTGSFVASSTTQSVPGIVRGGTTELRALRVRGLGHAHTRTTVDATDGLGHPLESTAHGRIRGEYGEPLPDERIVTHATYANVDLATGGWNWRGVTRHVDGHGDPTRLGAVTSQHSPEGDVTSVTTAVEQSVLPFFGGDAEAEAFGAPAPEDVTASSVFDAWGNVLTSCAGGDAGSTVGCLRLGQVTYDGDYALVPLVQRVATRRGAGGLEFLTTIAVWDTGHLHVLEATDATGETTAAFYDGLGRPTLVRGPGAAACSDAWPSGRVDYLDTSDPTTSPVGRVRSVKFLSCTDPRDVLETVRFVDGLGRERAALVSGPDQERPWVKTNIALLGPRGAVRRMYQPAFYRGEADDMASVLAAAVLTPSVHASYDAFERPVLSIAEDGAPTRTVYHALSVDVWDPLDLAAGYPAHGTPTTTRRDGHGRAIDQVLRNRQPGASTLETYRLFTQYRADGALVRVDRAQTTSEAPRVLTSVVAGRTTGRSFFHDTIGRRIAASDPDTDSPTTGATWRYLFNRANDLVAVRDPRGCGQNFYVDLAGRTIGEAYVGCAASQQHEAPVAAIEWGVGLTELTSPRAVDVFHQYDSYDGTWAPTPQGFADYPADSGALAGRLAAAIDRGQRSVFAYDRAGNLAWEARQMALLEETPGPVVYDEEHTYVRTASFDHGNRRRSMVLPADPDFAPGQAGPRIAGATLFDRRGLPRATELRFLDAGGGTLDERTIVADVEYARDGRVIRTIFGDDLDGARTPTQSTIDYDARRRPRLSQTVRAPTAVGDDTRPLAGVSVVHAQSFEWDAVSNLLAVDDLRSAGEWPAGQKPQHKRIQHDALNRITGIEYEYAQDDGTITSDDAASDWRLEQMRVRSADPMRQRPAPLLTMQPVGRVVSQIWEFDWLGNATTWTDDAHQFHERSLGTVTNGSDLGAGHRPSALYLAADLAGPVADRGGWTEVDHDDGGNVVAMTVHAQCIDAGTSACADPGGPLASRRATLSASCICIREQRYAYGWDELNRLVEARRWDREGGSGDYTLQVTQQYRYDGANNRTVKTTIDVERTETTTLYVYPGDVERRGLTRAAGTYVASSELGTQTEYLVAGARIVWQAGDPDLGIDADHRISFAVTDLLGSTSAVIDLRSGELTQVGSFYPNGARETLRTSEAALVSVEPLGFTGKEDDQEVGLVYFGERYLMPGLGRWASADPLAVHSLGGGEALNSYHYVGGSLLESRDRFGLDESALDNLVKNEDEPNNAELLRFYARPGNRWSAQRKPYNAMNAFIALALGTTVAALGGEAVGGAVATMGGASAGGGGAATGAATGGAAAGGGAAAVEGSAAVAAAEGGALLRLGTAMVAYFPRTYFFAIEVIAAEVGIISVSGGGGNAERGAAVVASIRKKFDVSKSKNIAWGFLQTGKEVITRIAISGKEKGRTGGLFAKLPEETKFVASAVREGETARVLDSERKFLEDLAANLDPDTVGVLYLYSERAVCTSCGGVIDQFKAMYKNIEVIVQAGTE